MRLALLAVVIAVQLVAFAPQILHGRLLSGGELLYQFPPFDAPSLRTVESAAANGMLGDPVFHIDPWLDEAARQVRRGEFPLWNPCQFAGAPLHGNYEAALLYPPQWLHFLLPPGAATLPIAMLSLVVAGFFTALVARRLGLGVLPAAFAGVAFSLLPWLNFQLLWPMGSVGSLLPLSIFAADVLATAPSFAAAAGLALAFALELLAGHPETALHAGLFTTAWFAWRALGTARRPEGRRAAGRAAGLFALAGVAGLLLAAAQVIPFAQYLLESAAWRARTEAVRHASIPTTIGWRLLTLALPTFFGDPARGGYWGGINFPLLVSYVGVPTLVFAAASLASVRERREVAFLLVAGVVFFVISLDPPVVHDVVRAIPLLGWTAPDRLKVVSGFCLAIAAAFGLDAALEGRGAPRRRAWLAAGAGVALLTLAVAGFSLEREALAEHGGAMRLAPKLAWLGALALGSAACVAVGRPRAPVGAAAILLVAVDLIAVVLPWHPALEPERRHPETPAIAFLREHTRGGEDRIAAAGMTLPPNVASAYGLADVRGHDAMTPWRYDLLMRQTVPGGRDPLRRRMSDAMEKTTVEYFESGDRSVLKRLERPLDRARIDRLRDEWLESGMPPREFLRTKPRDVARGILLPDLASPLLDLLGVRFVIVPREGDAPGLDDERYRPVFDGEARIYENLRAFPRAFLVGGVEIASSPDDAVTRLVDRAFDARGRAIVEVAPEPVPSSGGEARIVSRTASGVVVDTEADGASLLVVTDSYLASGLQATVDGRAAPILAADVAFRGVALPPGRHRVEIGASAAALRAGLLVTGGTAAALAIGAILSRMRSRSTAKRAIFRC